MLLFRPSEMASLAQTHNTQQNENELNEQQQKPNIHTRLRISI